MSRPKPLVSRQPAARPAQRRTPGLELRRRPQQPRGQATFDRILAITAELLEQRAAEEVTTNLIAKAAGINVATLYQYFPNKQAVLLSLSERQSQERIATCAARFDSLAEASNWRARLREAIDALARLRREQKGALALRQIMRADPDLRGFEYEHEVDEARDLAAALVAIGDLDVAEAALVARCCLEALNAVVDLWLLETDGRDDRFPEHARTLVDAYITRCIEQRRERDPRAQKRA